MLLQGFMNWNAVRHVPGSSADPDADTIKVIMDQRGRFNSMVMIIHAGNDQMFWQLRVAADKPEFTTDRPGGGGIPGSKARVLQRLREHGWEDAIKVRRETFFCDCMSAQVCSNLKHPAVCSGSVNTV